MTGVCVKRTTLLSLAFFFASTFTLAQLPPANPAPGQSDGVIGPQKPQPIPEPDQTQPSSQNQQSQDQSAQPRPQQQPEPETQQTTSQSISGTIAKVNNKYVLQTSDSVTYQLDDQTTAGQYVGKHVKVTGTLDRTTGVLRVRSIELLS